MILQVDKYVLEQRDVQNTLGFSLTQRVMSVGGQDPLKAADVYLQSISATVYSEFYLRQSCTELIEKFHQDTTFVRSILMSQLKYALVDGEGVSPNVIAALNARGLLFRGIFRRQRIGSPNEII